MIRTQIQLPDQLYHQAKAFAAERELSLAEMTRRGLELFLARYPKSSQPAGDWKVPQVDGGGIKLPLSKLRDMVGSDETVRSLNR